MSDPVKIVGFDRLIRKMRQPDWAAGPVGRLLDRWRFFTERTAKGNIKRGPGGWLWKGHDRRSLTSERDTADFPLWARVGSNSPKIRFGEFGTNRLAEDPSTANRPWPTGQQLQPWARAHGLNAWAVAAGIKRRGGLKPRRFLRNAVDASEAKIPGWLATAAREMEREASAGV